VNRIKPHIMFLKHSYIYWMIFILIFIGIQVVVFSMEGFSRGESLGESLILYKTQLTILGIFFPALFSLNMSIKEFSGAMSIRADRKAFIKTSIIYIIVISISTLALVSLIEGILTLLANNVSSGNVKLDNEVELMDMIVGDGGIIGSFFGMFISQLAFCSLGFMLGAIIYRVDIKTNIILFVGLPIVAALYITRLSYIKADIITKIGENILWILDYLIHNPSIFYALEVLVFVVTMGLASLMLKNAPIKDYAHSKLRIKMWS
jgi:hypothetical protein